MTFANVLVYLALIGYILFKRVQGQPVSTPKRLFGLPIVLIVVGYGDLGHTATMKPVEIALTVTGAAVSLALGLLRGRADRLSLRNGAPFVQWGARSLILFVSNLAAKLVLDVIAVASGAGASTVGKSLLLTFGMTLLGEAIVVWLRTGAATGFYTPSPARQPRS